MAETTESLVLVERDDHAAIMTLNRPAKKNAMNNDLLGQLNAAIRSANDDDEVHAIVLRGSGTCFTSGRDTKQFTHVQNAVLQD